MFFLWWYIGFFALLHNAKIVVLWRASELTKQKIIESTQIEKYEIAQS